jgi:hypothetical protein
VGDFVDIKVARAADGILRRDEPLGCTSLAPKARRPHAGFVVLDPTWLRW